jgi:pimeloyl-ACP methyl ester carboxylesterase
MAVTLSVLAIVLLLALCVAAGLALFAAHTARRVETLLPPLGAFIEVDGARIHYVDKGAGPPLVLIHGLGGQLRHFTHSMVDRLVGEYRVVMIDRPGAGHSTRARGASNRLSAQADVVASVIRALELERPLLVGHSLGGAVSLAVALAHPGLVGGLALIAPLSHVETEPPPVFEGLAIRSSVLRRIVAWTLATPIGIRNSRAMLAQIFAPEPVPPDFATAGGGLLALRPSAFFETSSDMAAVNDDLPSMVPRYPQLRFPVGILFGRQDNILAPAAHGEALAAAIPGATLELVDGGHMLPFTAPDRCAAFVRDVARRIR